MANREFIQRFLNKECIWIQNKASCSKKKVLTATTAMSPMVKKSMGLSADYTWFLNVTVLILKPKDSLPCVTVYFNGEPVLCSHSTAISMQPVTGSANVFTVYFGSFTETPAFPVPMDPSIIDTSACSRTPSATEILHASALHTVDLSNTYVTVAPTAWVTGNQLVEYVLCTDYQMMCPPLTVFPSLARILNLLTKCDDGKCKKCAGYRCHVNVYKGHTGVEENGFSARCPCVLSCGIHDGKVNITGNQTLLPLLFDPVVAHTVKKLVIGNKDVPAAITDIVSGLTETDHPISVNSKAWSLVMHSDWHSHTGVVSCRKIKRRCLHSY